MMRHKNASYYCSSGNATSECFKFSRPSPPRFAEDVPLPFRCVPSCTYASRPPLLDAPDRNDVQQRANAEILLSCSICGNRRSLLRRRRQLPLQQRQDQEVTDVAHFCEDSPALPQPSSRAENRVVAVANVPSATPNDPLNSLPVRASEVKDAATCCTLATSTPEDLSRRPMQQKELGFLDDACKYTSRLFDIISVPHWCHATSLSFLIREIWVLVAQYVGNRLLLQQPSPCFFFLFPCLCLSVSLCLSL